MTTEPDTRDWFTIPLRGKVPEDKLGSLRFIPSPYKKPTFDPAVVMRRYMDAETIKEWDRDGTTIVRGCKSGLWREACINRMQENPCRYPGF